MRTKQVIIASAGLVAAGVGAFLLGRKLFRKLPSPKKLPRLPQDVIRSVMHKGKEFETQIQG